MSKFFKILLCMVLFFGIVMSIHADELDDITKQLTSLTAELNSKESDKTNIAKQITGIRSRVDAIGVEVVKKEKEVAEGEKNLEHQKTLLDERARSYYKNINKSGSALIGLLIGENFSDSLQNFFYQKVVVDEDRNAIVKIVLYIKNLEDTKQKLVEEKRQLAAINRQLDSQSALLEGEIASTRSKVAQLTARQQELIASRISGLHLSRSAGSFTGCVDDRTLDPGFGSGFAFYTYGIPDRVGLSQYGAKGRADAGQNMDTILKAYYNFDSYQSATANINVNDSNEIDAGNIIWSGSLEDYIKRIYEVPASWPAESLKAQAVAARSYVLAKTENGSKSICASTYCQYFKQEPKGGAWEQAVNDTNGQVMVKDGSIISAWFSSTFGGFAHTSGQVWGGERSWTKNFADTSSSIGSFGELNERAYDKESACFYTAQGSRGDYGKSAWLRPSEVADIANTLLLVKKDSSTTDNLYQTDKANPAGKENWNSDKVKSMLSNPFNNVSDVRVTGADFGGGNTTQITVSEGGHEEVFSGDEWRSRFNLRAPANISIVGPLYNIEKR